jgi:tryptophan synthase beta subunit
MSDTNNTNSKGRFGRYGGQYVPETLMNAVNELEEAYNHYKDDPEFNKELTDLLNNFALLCRKNDKGFRWRKGLFKERRFKSYRFS